MNITVFHWFTSYFDIMHQGKSNQLGLSKTLTPKLLQFLKWIRRDAWNFETMLWNLSSGCGLRACSWHEQSIAILSRAFSFVSVSLCFISQCARKHYLMIFSLILWSIFRQQNLHQTVKGEQESEICNASAILQVSGKLNLLMNLNRVPLIVLGFFNFHFPIDFIGGQ